MKRFFLVLFFFLAFSSAQADDSFVEPKMIQTFLATDSAPLPYKEELRRFYEYRHFYPAWETNHDKHKEGLEAFLTSVLAYTHYHGLSKSRYPVERIRQLIAEPKTENELQLEILISSWLIQIAHDMQGDDVRLELLYPGWRFERAKIDVPLELQRAIRDSRVQAFFDDLAPRDSAYTKLADALRSYEEIQTKLGAWPIVPQGPSIKPGMTDQRLKIVRLRLEAEGYTFPASPEGKDGAFFDEPLRDVIIAYQARNGLEADGNIGSKTLAALNVSLDKRIQQLRANMERLRHMPEEMPPRYAMVNIADASIKVVANEQILYHAVVIVGKPSRKTPFIQSKIRSVIFNPSWHVPARIAREDILPKLRQDPHYLEKMGFVINGSAEDPHGEAIDWNLIESSEFNFRLRQSPGDLNSLGRIKFDFDNDFAVYLHDTSHPELFNEVERFRSSGCIRIKDPALLANLVLAHNEGDWSEAAIEEIIAKGKTKWLKVDEPLPLFIVYETAFFPTSESLIHFRKDVYNYDSFLMDRLEGPSKMALKDKGF